MSSGSSGNVELLGGLERVLLKVTLFVNLVRRATYPSTVWALINRFISVRLPLTFTFCAKRSSDNLFNILFSCFRSSVSFDSGLSGDFKGTCEVKLRGETGATGEFNGTPVLRDFGRAAMQDASL